MWRNEQRFLVIQFLPLREKETTVDFLKTFVRILVLALVAWGIVAFAKFLIGA